MKLISGLFGSIVSLFILNGCGSGSSVPTERPAKSISGNAVDAVITNGVIRAYAWDNGVQGELLGEA